MNRTIVWFRRDLRLVDHEPLFKAARRGAIIPVFVFDQALLHHPETGVARVAFMLDCLASLDIDLQRKGGRLIFRSGNPIEVLPHLVQETQAEGIYAYTDCERIYGRVRDARLNQALADRDMKIRWFEPPASVPELITYPEYRLRWFRDMAAPIVPEPAKITVPTEVTSTPLPSLKHLQHVADGKPIPKGGTAEARKLLANFLSEKSDRYYWQLSYPSAEATTGLSPYLKFGTISVRECVQTIQRTPDKGDFRVRRSHQQLIARLRWGNGFTQRFRYLPQLELRSLYSVFDEDGWDFDEELYQAWQIGHTGFPIVDAAARCLQASGGWQALNFRTRAIYASFLSNLLGMDWRYGALHFMRHLIDGDCPIDHYQWAMQSGVTHCLDKTWTRIYNPGQVAVDRCDPDGIFIRRWVPELAHLPAEQLGSPPLIKGYPNPILDYRQARQQRVQRLTKQRGRFLSSENIVPYLAGLPKDLVPFGADRYPSETSWAKSPAEGLFPASLDLSSLDALQAETIRTWFVAHVNIKSPKIHQRKPRSSTAQLSLNLNI
ncbi:MAG: FAD-binding domain-containing protein [Cyanobacteria bacterium P01_F01_bin.86]